MTQGNTAPPRRIEPGDIVAAYSEHLAEWTAAQITDLDPAGSSAGVLELDWSGPEPGSVAELGDVRPLRLAHHSWAGTLSHCNYDWVLPRSFKVVGSLPLLHDRRSPSYGSGWEIGRQLFLQRRWDQGHRDRWSDPWALECAGDELAALLEESTEPDQAIRRLSVHGIEALDGGRLVERFPLLTALTLSGDLGTLSQASRLNELTFLKRLSIRDLFGMSAPDCLLPSRTTALESLELHSVPAEYAAAMRSAWRSEVSMGTHLAITKPRKPGWADENRDNPFREWEGDDAVPRAAFKKALAQYQETRAAVLAVLSDAPSADRASRVFEIGARYGAAFNELDERHGFIDTIERERLFDVLDRIVDDAEARLGIELAWARESLTEGTESARDW